MSGYTSPGRVQHKYQTMFYFVLMSCLSAVIGSSFYNWWETTRIGCWFNRRLDALMNWTSQRLHLKNFSRAENVMAKIQRLESEIQQLKQRLDDLDGISNTTKRKR